VSRSTPRFEEELRAELDAAWLRREKAGELARLSALRIFHGAGDSRELLRCIAIDRFGAFAWITEWEGDNRIDPKLLRGTLTDFLKAKGFESAVALWRPDPSKGIPDEPEVLFGVVPEEAVQVREGALQFWVRLSGVRHPGLFLDHEPLRRWLTTHAQGWSVLNLFAYTGSLSVACGCAGARSVTTLDLSKPTIEWARENGELNGLGADRMDYIYGDTFEWLQKFAKKQKRFDCVILDPPSFSRDKKGGSFSTSRDLTRLHEGVFAVLEPGGLVISSINSANVPIEKYEQDLVLAAKKTDRHFQVLHRFDLPETFPTRLGGSKEQRYLKGFILRELT
jgi:23S rRNA G2069 N7-methylase RlmK/C1962 C5-methylase RlmI